MGKKLHWIFLTSVLISLLVLAGGVCFYWLERKANQNYVKTELQAIGQLKIDQIVAWRVERLADAEVLMGSVSLNEDVAQWIETHDPSLEEKILRQIGVITKAYHYDRIILVGAEGQVLLSSNDRLGRVSEEEAQAMVIAQRQQKPVLTDLYLDPDTSSPRISVVSPVPTRAGAAVILESDPWQFLYPMIESWPVPRNSAETTLARRDGDQVLYLNELRHQKSPALKLRIPLTRVERPAVMAVLGKEGVIFGKDYRDVEVLAYLSAVPDSPWFIVAKMDTQEAFAASRTQSALILPLVLLFLAVIFSSAAFISQKIRKEVMLQQAEKKIRILNTDLERRVEQRTAELQTTNASLTDLKSALDEHSLVSVTDTDGIITYANDKFCEISKYTREELLGQNHRIINSGYHPPEFFRGLWNTALSSQVWKGEIRNRSKDGTIYWVSTTIIPFLGEDGKPLQFIAIRTDISEIKQAEERINKLNATLEIRATELEASNKELDAFSYSVSHDLRAPLRAVDGYSRMVEEDCAEDINAEGRRMLGVIRSETKRMSQLIDNLLEFSRLGRQQKEPERIDMQEMAQEVYDELVAQDPSGRKLKLDLQPLPMVDGTKSMIRQVWVNLIGNAIKFTKEREVGEIEIAAQLDENGVTVFRIKDNGAGFDMRFANKLFGVFQRLHDDKEFPGIGIGLSLTQRIINRHGGRIWAVGEVDHGATFYFTLPNPISITSQPTIP